MADTRRNPRINGSGCRHPAYIQYQLADNSSTGSAVSDTGNTLYSPETGALLKYK
ncbi:hypothetical protein [Aliamphritea hakodatensis]|uniref:hypothetical protein n=1 Tax=Aliamphritea hakodatensis TaxID=2895352 RepID=UPI0022FDACC2|nr:hypothetical protein [Aliamphritea hakodatensis]